MRTASRLLEFTNVALVVGVFLIGSSGVANAAGGVGSQERPGEFQSIVTFENGLSPNAKNSIASEIDASRRDRTRGAAMKLDFEKRVAAEYGRYYSDDRLDYLRLERADNAEHMAVELVVPRDYQLTQVQLGDGRKRDAEGNLHATVFASATGTIGFDPDDVVAPDGPGFSSFEPQGAGQYLLKPIGVGELLATWAKERSNETSDTQNDYWSYQRKGKATAYDISGPNFGLDDFGIKSYPNSAGKPYIYAWKDWAPSTGTWSGNCDQFPVSLPLSYGGATTTISYSDCDHYRSDIASSSPGDMSVNWDNGLTYPFGPREAAFNWIIVAKQSFYLSFNDYQQINFWNPTTEQGAGCGSTNNSNC